MIKTICSSRIPIAFGITLAACLFGSFAGGATCWAVELPPRPSEDQLLAERLRPLIDSHQGNVAVAIKHLGNGSGFLYQADEPLPTASLIKMAVMVATYHQIHQGTLSRSQTVALKEEDKVPGSGILTEHFSEGTHLSIRDAVRLMMAYSDNTATNLVVDQIGLPVTTELMSSLSFPNTRLHSKVYRRDTSLDLDRSKRFGLGSTTAVETIALLEWIARGEILTPEICDEMMEHLYANQDRSKLARLLPPKVRIAHKSGDVNASRCDAGLIDGPDGQLAICVLTDENRDRSWSDDNEALVLMGEIATVAYRHYYPQAFQKPTTSPSETGNLRIGSSGRVVESLQRTLNAKLDPSPQLDIDGDFGPATEQAVMRFQQSVGIAASGVVDEATRGALGDLSPSGPTPPTSPGAEQPPRPKVSEVLTGPPVVSCKAWAILDAQSGDVLFEHQGRKKLDNASTTKLMTAWLVAKLAASDPAVLDETLTFSKRADDTLGSTAGIRAGETVRVGDLLYGLLLPSGNDASVALAEHFGGRLELADGKSAEPLSAADAYERFVKAMNEEAATLGLSNTAFRNPHGLTAPGHGASASDLGRLGICVLNDPVLSPIVSTRRHLYRVQTPDGGTREVDWRNTNQLLDIDGYDGLKTGTTTAAGACLVASGNRNERRVIVVVLGASGSDARYSDARNLFRWAWQETAAR